MWRNCCLTLLLGQFTGLSALQLGNAGQTLGAEDTTAPVTTDLLMAVIEVGLHSLQNLAEVSLVVVLNGGQSQSGASLAAHQTTQASLTLDNAVGHTHLAAQSGQEEHQLKAKQEMHKQLDTCFGIADINGRGVGKGGNRK